MISGLIETAYPILMKVAPRSTMSSLTSIVRYLSTSSNFLPRATSPAIDAKNLDDFKTTSIVLDNYFKGCLS